MINETHLECDQDGCEVVHPNATAENPGRPQSRRSVQARPEGAAQPLQQRKRLRHAGLRARRLSRALPRRVRRGGEGAGDTRGEARRSRCVMNQREATRMAWWVSSLALQANLDQGWPYDATEPDGSVMLDGIRLASGRRMGVPRTSPTKHYSTS